VIQAASRVANNLYVLPAPTDLWTILSTVGTLVAAVAAVVGLWFAVVTMRQSNRAVQLQVLEHLVSQIRDLEFRYNTEYKNKSEEDKRFWDCQFFNTIEFLAFVINRRLTRAHEIAEFFKGGVIHWYEDLFLRNFPKTDHVNPDKFPEFKKLYSKLKERSIAQNPLE
jgi:hypothetical protein